MSEETRRHLQSLRLRKYLPELKKQQHNLNVILQCSNATPFRDRNVHGYLCAFCALPFEDPADLRTHTHTSHKKIKTCYKQFVSNLANYVVFLDTNALKCTICETPAADLRLLSKHLVEIHKKLYYTDVTDYMQPFKLTTELNVDCCICTKSYNSFKLLIQHMNTHFSNFICSICGAGFVNKYRLIRHIRIHNKKQNCICKFCKEEFATETKRKKHENNVHLKVAGQNKCQICYERFPNYYQKSRHMMEVHNADKVKCNACERQFVTRTMLAVHIRRDHLLERSYECHVCKHRFFQKKRLEEHYVVHTRERAYKCDVCGKLYARRKNLNVHLRTHTKSNFKT